MNINAFFFSFYKYENFINKRKVPLSKLGVYTGTTKASPQKEKG